MRRARCIIAVSEQTRRDLIALLGIDPATVRVIYSGLNEAFRPMPERRNEIRARLGLSSGPLVLHVGQVGFYKNVEGCLRVVARLRKQGIEATFVRAGNTLAPAQRDLQRRLGLDGAVRDLGRMGGVDLADLYAACDVLLFPSLYEGFGWPPLEAMASGLPVVCSRSGSLAEVVGTAALTAEPEDVEGLTRHVAAALTDQAVARDLRQRGLARARFFEWDRATGEILEVYRQVVER
jgi:glycosyltransferase involved in cell wall biosynthesis